MMPHKNKLKKLICLASFLLNTQVFAESLSLDTKIEEKKSKIGLSYETSNFSTNEGSIHGMGGKLDFIHSFTNVWSVDLFLSTALNSQGSVQNRFTGLGVYFLYTLFGEPYSSKKTTLVNNQPIATETSIIAPQSLLVGPGLNQYFLNGNQGIYSSSGLSATAIYNFELFKINWKLSSRYTMMSASSNINVKGLFFDFGFTLAL